MLYTRTSYNVLIRSNSDEDFVTPKPKRKKKKKILRKPPEVDPDPIDPPGSPSRSGDCFSQLSPSSPLHSSPVSPPYSPILKERKYGSSTYQYVHLHNLYLHALCMH